MIVYPSLPSGHTVFCDDIRHENTGKVTFVGTYGANLYVNSIPSVIPKICCAITYREKPDASGLVKICAIHAEDDEENILGEIEFEISPDQIVGTANGEPFFMRESRFFIEISPFNISSLGSLKVRAYRDGNEYRLGALAIGLTPQETERE